MKQWSAMLGQELNRWPDVTSKPMFGVRCFYRKKKVFAGLPVTRTLSTPNSLIFKITPMPPKLLSRAMKEPRFAKDRGPAAKWFSFEVNSPEDLREALWWLNQAYEHVK
jgi:hypothetical protein